MGERHRGVRDGVEKQGVGVAEGMGERQEVNACKVGELVWRG